MRKQACFYNVLIVSFVLPVISFASPSLHKEYSAPRTVVDSKNEFKSSNCMRAHVEGSKVFSAHNYLRKAQTDVAKDSIVKHNQQSLRNQMLVKAALNKEGLIGSTAIKTDKGYCKIAELKVGDRVACYDVKNSQQSQSIVTHSDTLQVTSYIQITINDQVICVAPDHKFYMGEANTGVITAQEIKDNIFLRKLVDPRITDVQEIAKPLDVVRITVDGHHNFYITEHDILVHNYVPVVFEIVAITGVTVATLAVKAAIVSIGGWLVYKQITAASKKSNVEQAVPCLWNTPIEAGYQKQDIQRTKEQLKSVQAPAKEQQKTTTGGGPQMPKDPDKDKKKDTQKAAEQKPARTVDDLVKESTPLEKRKESNKSTQYEKPGDFTEAQKDFQSLKPTNIQDISSGKAGILPDGRKVNVRSQSDDKRPTLEIMNADNTRIKFRYGEKQGA